jgi:hypothetical protein
LTSSAFIRRRRHLPTAAALTPASPRTHRRTRSAALAPLREALARLDIERAALAAFAAPGGESGVSGPRAAQEELSARLRTAWRACAAVERALRGAEAAAADEARLASREELERRAAAVAEADIEAEISTAAAMATAAAAADGGAEHPRSAPAVIDWNRGPVDEAHEALRRRRREQERERWV